MPNYYNRTQGPISVALADGTPLAIPPKGLAEIARDDEGAASLQAAISRGDLTRLPDLDLPPSPLPASPRVEMVNPRPVPVIEVPPVEAHAISETEKNPKKKG